MSAGLIERLKLKDPQLCPSCLKTNVDQDTNYCAYCGHPLKLAYSDSKDKEVPDYKEYEVISKEELKKLRIMVADLSEKQRKLSDELFYLKEIKYHSSWSTLQAALGIDFPDRKKGIGYSLLSIGLVAFIIMGWCLVDKENENSLTGLIIIYALTILLSLGAIFVGLLGILNLKSD